MSAKPLSPRDLLDTATRRRVAATAPADERTVDKVLLGQPVRGDVGNRVRALLQELGITPLPPQAGGDQ